MSWTKKIVKRYRGKVFMFEKKYPNLSMYKVTEKDSIVFWYQTNTSVAQAYRILKSY